MKNQLKDLRRSKDNRILFGVCAGLADHMNIDVTIMRAVFILLALIQGIGVLLYIILFLLIPEEDSSENRASNNEIESLESQTHDEIASENSKPRNTIAIALVLVGLVLLAGPYITLSWLTTRMVFAILLIAVGIIILIKRK